MSEAGNDDPYIDISKPKIDSCGMSREDILDLVAKVNANHDALLRGETTNYRLKAVETKVEKLCGRITNGLLGVVSALFVGMTILITGFWHIVTWIQKLIEHTVLVA